jgi:chromosome segregation ATPase
MVRGFGDTRQGQVLNWRRAVESEARRTAPASLPTSEEQQIRAKYTPRLEALQKEQEVAKEEATAAQAAIRRQHQQRAAEVAQECQVAQQTASAFQAKHNEEMAALRRSVSKVNWEAAVIQHQLEGYAEITFWQYLGRLISIGHTVAGNRP